MPYAGLRHQRICRASVCVEVLLPLVCGVAVRLCLGHVHQGMHPYSLALKHSCLQAPSHLHKTGRVCFGVPHYVITSVM